MHSIYPCGNISRGTRVQPSPTLLAPRYSLRILAGLRHFLLYRVVLHTPVSSGLDAVIDLFIVSWREHMTKRYLRLYYSRRAFYFMKLHSEAAPAAFANPDARLSTDVAAFTRLSTDIAGKVVGKIATAVAMARVLWSISPRLLVVLLLYSAVVTGCSVGIFGQRIAALTQVSGGRSHSG